MPDMNEWPAVTCLCPTYGRFSLLRDALACFLAQDYPGEKRLLILNDAPMPLLLPAACSLLTAVNRPSPFGNLGEKRQWLLEAADSPLVAHWDDDDLYLPWHLTRGVAALVGRDVGPDLRSQGEVGPDLRSQGEVGCVKSRGAYYMVGRELRGGIHHNVFEGSMVFRREEALALGGYPALHSGQAKALMGAFEKAGRLYKIPDHESFAGSCLLSAPCCLPSYVYRWGQPAVGHISAIGNKDDGAARFRQQNTDFGSGEPLTPADLTVYRGTLLDGAWNALPGDAYLAFEQRLIGSVPSVPLW